jgi:hypothetical protein
MPNPKGYDWLFPSYEKILPSVYLAFVTSSLYTTMAHIPDDPRTFHENKTKMKSWAGAEPKLLTTIF